MFDCLAVRQLDFCRRWQKSKEDLSDPSPTDDFVTLRGKRYVTLRSFRSTIAVGC